MRFRLLRFRSPLLTESLLISFPVLLRWFTSHSFSLPTYFIQPRSAYIAVCGLPHSVIPVSLDMCSSTRLFAAYHDLLRLASPQQASAIDLYLLDHIIHSAYLVHSSLSKTVQAISSTKLVLFLSVAASPSYIKKSRSSFSLFYCCQRTMEIRGLEPLTLGLQSRCSSQLS